MPSETTKPLPRHIAIIMDGNGRWAKQRGLSRSMGHQQGVEAVNRITAAAVHLGIKYLTLYTFSMENWNRPMEEVNALMALLLDSLEEEIFMKNNVRLRTIGDMERLAPEVVQAIRTCEEHTARNDAMTLVLAISYSARWELTRAARFLAEQVAAGTLRPQDITEETLAAQLTTEFMPDPDLLIRTGGEYRLSNYLLWQCAYSELYFTPTFWPDFSSEELSRAIYNYQHRERRYGKTSEQILNA